MVPHAARNPRNSAVQSALDLMTTLEPWLVGLARLARLCAIIQRSKALNRAHKDRAEEDGNKEDPHEPVVKMLLFGLCFAPHLLHFVLHTLAARIAEERVVHVVHKAKSHSVC